MYLTQLTLSFLMDKFSRYSVIHIVKLPGDLFLLNEFSTVDFGAKRSLVKCDSILNGVILHLKDVELSPNDTMLFSRKDKKTANNQFSHFCRTDRSAGTNYLMLPVPLSL